MTKHSARGWMAALALVLATGCGSTVPGGADASADADAGIVPDDASSVLRGVTTVALSPSHACAVRADGRVACWGANESGQSRPDRRSVLETQPAIVAGLPAEIGVVAVGYDHSCAIDAAGGVWCWGDNSSGQLGDGTDIDARAPRAVVGLADADRLALGADISCARTRAGDWSCWGSGRADSFARFHRAALGATQDVGAPSLQVVPLAAGAEELRLGIYVGCMRRRTGPVQCWNWNGSAVLSPLAGTDDVTQLAVGDLSACVLHSGGRVTCWANPMPTATPIEILGIPDVTSLVAVGSSEYCGLRPGGAIGCFSEREPTAIVTPLPPSVAIFGGGNLCARGEDGRVRCMVVTDNQFGQLGDAIPHVQIEPVTVVDVSDAIALSVDLLSTNVITRGGDVRWWGASLYDVDHSRPAPLGTLDRVAEMSGRCARRTDGSVACRQSAVAATVSITEVSGPSDITEIAASAQWVVARTPDRRVRCLQGDCSALEGVGDVQQVTANEREIFVRLGDGTVRSLLQRIREGTRVSETVIVPVELPEPAELVAAGGSCGCARLRSQQVACWGACGFDSPAPGAVYRGVVRPELAGARSLGVTSNGVCIVDAAGAVRCTNTADATCVTDAAGAVRCSYMPIGGRIGGRIASGTNDLSVSIATPIASGAVAVVRDPNYACALMADGRVRCWGDSTYGALGDGRRSQRRTTVELPSQD